jgi:quercetin dioxygenase-like cupin family protein
MKLTKSVVANVWIMQVELTYKGDSVDGHIHEFDHQHLLSVGEVDLTVDGKTTRHIAPTILFIEKGKLHGMCAVTDYSLGYCIHPIRNGTRVEDIVSTDTPETDNFKTAHGGREVAMKDMDVTL